jgi:hypothetical protein
MSSQLIVIGGRNHPVRPLIIDELGYVPLSQTGAELLFEVFSQRYERGSTIVTSNLPFDEWTNVFGSERLTGALLDRLTHHVHILQMNGDSYRLNQSNGERSATAAGLGSDSSGTAPAGRNAAAVVGGASRRLSGWIRLQPLLRALPRLGGPAVADDAANACRRRAYVRGLRRHQAPITPGQLGNAGGQSHPGLMPDEKAPSSGAFLPA